MVPDFLSRIYLAEMSVSEDEDGDRKLALEKNKIYIPLQDRSCFLERLHRSYTGYLRTDKFFCIYITAFFLVWDVQRCQECMWQLSNLCSNFFLLSINNI